MYVIAYFETEDEITLERFSEYSKRAERKI